MSMVYFIPASQRKTALAAAQADDEPVMILGGPGTGKGAIGRWIHQNSPRASQPVVTTEKERPLVDQIREANRGTLIVDDVGLLSMSEQLLLLNVLKLRAIPHPTQTGMPMIVNVRIIALSNPQIDARARGGLFNDELLLRLSKNRIEMPSLAKRADEFEGIAIGILQEITHELHKEFIKGFNEDVWSRLRAYEWPGNLRELRNVLRLAVISCETPRIQISNMPDFGHDKINFQATRSEFEKTYLTELLKSFQHDLDKVARASRMERVILMDKLKRHGLIH